jgi:hypothetical protein
LTVYGLWNSLRRHYPDQVHRVESLHFPLSLAIQAPRYVISIIFL